jgi:hypothetical protein
VQDYRPHLDRVLDHHQNAKDEGCLDYYGRIDVEDSAEHTDKLRRRPDQTLRGKERIIEEILVVAGVVIGMFVVVVVVVGSVLVLGGVFVFVFSPLLAKPFSRFARSKRTGVLAKEGKAQREIGNSDRSDPLVAIPKIRNDKECSRCDLDQHLVDERQGSGGHHHDSCVVLRCFVVAVAAAAYWISKIVGTKSGTMRCGAVQRIGLQPNTYWPSCCDGLFLV